jgi:hypothetical protein
MDSPLRLDVPPGAAGHASGGVTADALEACRGDYNRIAEEASVRRGARCVWCGGEGPWAVHAAVCRDCAEGDPRAHRRGKRVAKHVQRHPAGRGAVVAQQERGDFQGTPLRQLSRWPSAVTSAPLWLLLARGMHTGHCFVSDCVCCVALRGLCSPRTCAPCPPQAMLMSRLSAKRVGKLLASTSLSILWVRRGGHAEAS